MSENNKNKKKIIINDDNQKNYSDISEDDTIAGVNIELDGLKLESERIRVELEKRKAQFVTASFVVLGVVAILFFISLLSFIGETKMGKHNDVSPQQWYGMAIILVTLPTSISFALLRYINKSNDKTDKDTIPAFNPSSELFNNFANAIIDFIKRKP